MPPMGSRAVLALVVVLAIGGCTKHEPRMPAACAAGEAAVERALARAPRSGALADGTLLSECVRRARSDAELQSLGIVLSRVADRLALAARAGGAARSNGLTLELSRRIDGSARGLASGGPRLRRSLAQGLDAGRARG